MNSAYKPWTWMEVLKGNPIKFLVLTIIFTAILNNVADKGLTYLMNTDNQTIYTYNYSLGVFGLILFIPAALFSILAIEGLLRLKSVLIRSPIAEEIGLSKLLENGISSEKSVRSFYSYSN